MKLRKRIIITVLSITGLSGLLTLIFSDSLYQYQSSNPDPRNPGWRHLSLGKHIMNRMTSFADFATTTTISTTADSDRAEEVVAGANETVWLANISLPPNAPKQKKKKLLTHEDLLRSCMKPHSILLHEEDGHGFYPDLIRLLYKESTKATPIRRRRTIQDIYGIIDHRNLTHAASFYLQISERDMYAERESLVAKVLQDMAELPIVNVDQKNGGTQLKLVLTFEDGSQALMKPMRFDRSKETDPNHFYFVDFERHVSEIATFHLDKILGFRRTPPVVGRLLNITSEIYAFSSNELIRTFFISPAKNLCFHGRCSYYCDTGHAICGRPDMLEGSLAMFLPPKSLSPRKTWSNPWKRSYHKRRKAEWETNDDYCKYVRTNPPYDKKQRLADVIDMSILDFLIGNMDRHHYETFKLFGNDSFIIHLDHGRGFGRSGHDEISILAPLYQCCLLRFDTFRRLLQLQYGARPLSHLMRCSLSNDPLDPVLAEKHLLALDRRLLITLEVVRDCLKRYPPEDVIYHDTDSEITAHFYEE